MDSLNPSGLRYSGRLSLFDYLLVDIHIAVYGRAIHVDIVATENRREFTRYDFRIGLNAELPIALFRYRPAMCTGGVGGAVFEVHDEVIERKRELRAGLRSSRLPAIAVSHQSPLSDQVIFDGFCVGQLFGQATLHDLSLGCVDLAIHIGVVLHEGADIDGRLVHIIIVLAGTKGANR